MSMQESDADALSRIAEELRATKLFGDMYHPDVMRLFEIAGRLRPAGEMSPWDDDNAAGNPNPWGPGPMEDYVLLSGQSSAAPTTEAVIDIFIRRNVPRAHQPHLLDTDDNDGEFLRARIREALANAERQGKIKARAKIRRKLGL